MPPDEVSAVHRVGCDGQQEIRRWQRFHRFYRGEQQYTLRKSPPAPSLIRRELERALAESHGRTDDFSRGRAELARKLLALFDNSA